MSNPPFSGSDWQSAIAAFMGAAASGALSGAPQAYTLLHGAGASGASVAGVQGGDYLWRVEGTFDGASVSLETLGLDGVTWFAALKADGSPLTVSAGTALRVTIGQGSTVRAAVGAGDADTSLYSVLAGV